MDSTRLVALIPDVSLNECSRAHNGTSWSPERRGVSARQEYHEHLTGCAEKIADQTPDGSEDISVEEFARFANGYLERFRACLSAHSRCISAMVTGPSNFPQARNQKRWASFDRRSSELGEFTKRAMRAILRKLNPTQFGISSDRADAGDLIAQRIAELQAKQEHMKKVNAAWRKAGKPDADNKDAWATVAGILGIDAGCELIRALRLGIARDFANRGPYPAYALQNNNANIRRLQQRAVDVERNASAEAVEETHGDITLSECPDDNRIRLVFPGKPDAETRTLLKRNGWRWSPRATAWQRHLNAAGRASARYVLEQLTVTA